MPSCTGKSGANHQSHPLDHGCSTAALCFQFCPISSARQIGLRELLTAFEKCLIERALEQPDGVQAEAARMLGLSRSDMGYKVTKYAIGRPADGA